MGTLDNLKKEAKRWLKALRDNDPAALARLGRAYPAAPDPPTLRDVQHALARERRSKNWVALSAQLANRPDVGTALDALLRAAAAGDVDAVAAALDADPSLIDRRGALGNSQLRTALHYGIRHPAVVRLLLERGADPNIRDEGDNAYPLHFAAEHGDLPVVTLLIEHGADPNGEGTRHLLDAVGWAVGFDSANHVEVARYLLAHGARYCLVTAVALGEPQVIVELASAGEDIRQRMDGVSHHRTLLHLAVLKRQPQAVGALIALGLPLDAEDDAGLTPLDQAALLGDEAAAQTLIDAGSRLTITAAVALDRRAAAAKLVATESDSIPDEGRWARLIVTAAARSPAPVVDRVLRAATRLRGGLSIVNLVAPRDVAVDNADRFTALHAAAFSGNTGGARVLLEHGADPRIRDSRWRATPAGWAAYAGRRATADVILQSNVDIFDAIDADRADVVTRLLDVDPGAIDRPFKSYAVIESEDGQWWPAPDCRPLEWAVARGKVRAAGVLAARGADQVTPEARARAERAAHFLRMACWDHHVHGKGEHRMYDRAAQRLLRQDPGIADLSLHTAIVCGNVEVVRQILRDKPGAAREAGGVRGWSPILYLAYTRFTHAATLDHATEIAALLLDAGADPNDFYMAGDARYSVLVGVAGEGEQDSPRQPYAETLFALLLKHGADPFDVQVLYDTHFSGDVLWWLQLVYDATIDTPRGAAWRDPEWRMLDMGGYGSGARFVLGLAITRRDARLAEWALARGANPNAPPARDPRFQKRSLYAAAAQEGAAAIAGLFAQYGADTTLPAFSADEQLVAAAMRLDREAVAGLLTRQPALRDSTAAMFEAARRDRPDVLALLIEMGFAVDVADATNARALHHAAARNARRAAQFLIERGAEIDPRETQYGGPPIGWAGHADHREMLDLLSQYSRYIWTLCFRGYVDRVREILAADPTLARTTDSEGHTPLWWLPDDEDQAMAIVELLLAAGADPAQPGSSGSTAADWARRRGMEDIADRLAAAAAARSQT